MAVDIIGITIHATSAIHALDGKSCKRHKDTLANFNNDYVKTQIFCKPSDEELRKQEKIVISVIMTIFILPQKKQKNRFWRQKN